jgi:hypothetical protein
MGRTGFFLAAIAVTSIALVTGCGDDDETSSGTSATTTTTTSSTTTSTGTGGSGGGGDGGAGGGVQNPPPPALGTQVDRFGRPAINTALNHVFDADAVKKDQAKDEYNANGAQAGWAAAYSGEFQYNLGILDSLDTVCGNQPLAGATVAAGRYAVLGGVLADDRIWVKTDAVSCGTYLAVEANAALGLVNGNCGGRALDYDVIDQSYSILAAGDITGSVGDGIDPDADTAGTTFPYLAKPH